MQTENAMTYIVRPQNQETCKAGDKTTHGRNGLEEEEIVGWIPKAAKKTIAFMGGLRMTIWI